MKEQTGNIWDFYDTNLSSLIVITTNGSLNRKGEAAMGRGIAKEAAERFKDLRRALGAEITLYGNRVHYFPQYRLLTFPVKRRWELKAEIPLVKKSLTELLKWAKKHLAPITTVYMVRPGCGSGFLDWKKVRPILKPKLSDQYVIVEKEK